MEDDLLGEVKAYLRLDGNEEDLLLTTIVAAAEAYLKGAGVVKTAPLDTRYKLATFMIASHWFENRDLIGSADELPFTFTALLMQLRYGAPESEGTA